MCRRDAPFQWIYLVGPNQRHPTPVSENRGEVASKVNDSQFHQFLSGEETWSSPMRCTKEELVDKFCSHSSIKALERTVTEISPW